MIDTNINDSDCLHRMILGAAFSLFLTDTLPDVTTLIGPTTSAIPEPSTWWLVLSGVAGLRLLGKGSFRVGFPAAGGKQTGSGQKKKSWVGTPQDRLHFLLCVW